MHHDDFKFEPIRGIPEALPADEHILWQGSPNPHRLAKEAWGLNWVIGYFVVLTIWRVGASSASVPFNEAMLHGVPFVLAGAFVVAVILVIAYVQAKSTVYTLTNKRALMRIGAALTMTLNLPYVCIGNAASSTGKAGIGNITFDLLGDVRLSYLMTWPHVRPWHMSRTQPSFRCIPDVERVARIFADAAETRVSQPQLIRVEPNQGANGTVPAE